MELRIVESQCTSRFSSSNQGSSDFQELFCCRRLQRDYSLRIFEPTQGLGSCRVTRLTLSGGGSRSPLQHRTRSGVSFRLQYSPKRRVLSSELDSIRKRYTEELTRKKDSFLDVQQSGTSILFYRSSRIWMQEVTSYSVG